MNDVAARNCLVTDDRNRVRAECDCTWRVTVDHPGSAVRGPTPGRRTRCRTPSAGHSARSVSRTHPYDCVGAGMNPGDRQWMITQPVGGTEPAGRSPGRIGHPHLNDVNDEVAAKVRTRRLTYTDCGPRGDVPAARHRRRGHRVDPEHVEQQRLRRAGSGRSRTPSCPTRSRSPTCRPGY